MPDDDRDAFPADQGALEGLARELGQALAPLDLDALPAGSRSQPTLWDNLVVIGSVLIGAAAFMYAAFGGKL